jgi:hypothetical protein
VARTKHSIQELASTLSGSEVVAVLAFLGLIYSVQVPFALKLFLWLVIALLYFHFVVWSQWTRKWKIWWKSACLVVVLPIIAWLGYKSLDDGPNIHIVGTLPVHLWETVPGPDSVPFVHHRLGFIVKVRNNNAVAPAHVDLAVLEGCAKTRCLPPKECSSTARLCRNP